MGGRGQGRGALSHAPSFGIRRQLEVIFSVDSNESGQSAFVWLWKGQQSLKVETLSFLPSFDTHCAIVGTLLPLFIP